MHSSSYFKTISLILMCLLSCSGCNVMMAASGTSGDLSYVSPSFPLGENREDAEDALGSPDKKCPRTSNDEQIIWYFFDEGIPPDAGSAALATAHDVATFGLFELLSPFVFIFMVSTDGPNGLMKVVYDKNDIVVSYKKYSSCQLKASYGPKGYKPGVMDCQEDQHPDTHEYMPCKEYTKKYIKWCHKPDTNEYILCGVPPQKWCQRPDTHEYYPCKE